MYQKQVLKFDWPFTITMLHGEGSIEDIVKEASKKHKDLVCDDDFTCTVAYTYSCSDSLCIYLVTNQDTTVEHLVHETEHITYFGLSKLPTAHEDSTDETYAYTQQAIFSKAYKTMINKFKVDLGHFLMLKASV